jgi:hypothetical protein
MKIDMVGIIMKSLKSLFGFNIPVVTKSMGMENDTEEVNLKTKTEQENFQVESMYTTLSEAKEEIWRRWNDKELRKKVEEYKMGNIPIFERFVLT